MATYTEAYSGISVTWQGGGNHAATSDGGLLIDGSVGWPMITSYTPAWSGGRNGAVLGIPGDLHWDDFPFDDRLVTNPSPNLPPITVPVGDTYVIAKSHTGATIPYTPTGYHAQPARSRIDYMLPITVVEYDPTVGGPYLRPPAHGVHPVMRQVRAARKFTEASIDMTRLPSVVDLGGVGMPDTSTLIADLEALTSHYNGSFVNAWTSRAIMPSYQCPNYGVEIGGMLGAAALALCSTESTATKADLARNICQWGLDLAGCWWDGRADYADGGHHCGYKGAIMLAGLLLNIDELMYIGEVFPGKFREDGAYFNTPWWFNVSNFDADTSTGWMAGWRKNSTNLTDPVNDGSLLASSPTGWGSPANFPNTWASQVHGYMWHTVGSDVCMALAMKLIEAETGFEMTRAWSESGVEMCRQWMDGGSLPVAASNALTAAGFTGAYDIQWGTGYGPVGYITGLAEAAYANHWS